MKAIILAAGEGIRLRPLTEQVPKCMVPLLGKSILERILAVLGGCNIEDITIVGGYRADRLASLGHRVEVNPDYAGTNMVATLFQVRHLLTGEADVLVSYGDIVYEPRVVMALLACDAPIALAVDVAWRRYWEQRMEDPLRDAETLKMNPRGAVIELGKPPRDYSEIEGQYMGLFKVRAREVPAMVRAYDHMDRDATYDGQSFATMYMTSFLQHLIGQGWTVQAVPLENGWLEVDTLADLAVYERMHLDRSLENFIRLDAES